MAEPKAPKKKHPGGRPTRYKKEYCQQLIDFFNVDTVERYEPPYADKVQFITNPPPMFQRFALKIGVHIDTLHEWRKRHVKFSEAYNTAKKIQEAMIAENALTNKYNPGFSKFMLAANHGWVEKQEIDVKGDMKHIVEVVNYGDAKD